ncbi:protein-L-isoaspartate(D-aspartate) O-methyltransferase [Aquibium sp. A9E412]|uniref:protein-L-isoaspartate(D-aspartate) O-methyltransferase n=1 Tax=Aquibium sp. A9E412 TaxID=2976767 RepID=UPI0025B0314B|nr:protein-L-isoaspartate(D-aspartate) O-methyltransferase [Aquibium sp. A9E412]MDN2564810.1 protein-L-isoaspartate(D-aspartate) O-methyltransferase [Aquibium sp. A9E412]
MTATAPFDEREGFAAFMLRMRAAGIGGKPLFSAMEAQPRSSFLPVEWQAAAWSPRMVPIGCGEAVEGADLQARVIDALALEPGHRVLEIGTGSGYTAAVMARLAARVLTLERFRTLADEARQRFAALGLANVLVEREDGLSGAAAAGPFDRIVVWAAFAEMPRSFADQLSSGGVMVAPIGPGDAPQALARLVKTGSRFEREDIGAVRLQPLAQGLPEAL